MESRRESEVQERAEWQDYMTDESREIQESRKLPGSATDCVVATNGVGDTAGRTGWWVATLYSYPRALNIFSVFSYELGPSQGPRKSAGIGPMLCNQAMLIPFFRNEVAGRKRLRVGYGCQQSCPEGDAFPVSQLCGVVLGIVPGHAAPIHFSRPQATQ